MKKARNRQDEENSPKMSGRNGDFGDGKSKHMKRFVNY